jgi:NADPH-dependent 2,4-dienoyl-CoA reductase/sulfur reductase-like enzyme
MLEDHFVVIGNGPSGNAAVLTLKEKAPEARVTLISRDPSGCYRPHLLPDHIAGRITEEDLFVTYPGSYKEMGIKFRPSQRVVGVNPQKRQIILEHKEILPYTGLIIAVGGRPRIPEPLLVFKDLMFTLKTLEDAKGWIEKLSRVKTVLIIGGDLTSLAVTKALLRLGKSVIFMLNEDAFWPLRLSDQLFEEVALRLEQKSVYVVRCRRITSMSRLTDGSFQVQMEDQSVFVDMVGAFFGLVPHIGFLAGSDLPMDRGLLVNEYLSTPFDGVYAAGDCAQIYHPEIRDYWVSIGHDNAVCLGQIAALNLLGCQVQAEAEMESIFNVQGIKVNTSWWTEF